MKKYLTIILLTAFCTQVQAQIVISGNVKNARTGELLSGANVTLHKKNSDNIIGYSICNSKGEFSAHAAAQNDSIDLRVAYLGYAEQRITITPSTQTHNFSLEEKEFILKESRIIAPKIRTTGDTIVYNASQFIREQDRMLTDILDRMPGVEVNKETGLVKYQGKNINRFYVENQNLMDGRYGEVSKNLPADAVKTVEVFENHQPVRALQDISYSDQAAMNIKLTDKAKGKWIGNGITAGLGFSPLLWKAELSAMRFSPKIQTYVTYKSNNIGQDITIHNHFVMISFLENVANTSAFYSPFISSPDLDKKRSLFNRSHVLSVNNLWKTGDDSNIRFNIDYKNEEKQQNSETTTKYFLQNDSVYVYNEKYNIGSYENKLGANFTYTKNSRKLFLENKFSANADWQKINSTIESNDNIHQNLRLPSFDVSNNFSVIVRNQNKRTYHFTSNNKFSVMPQKLFADITPQSGSATDFMQKANIKTFTSENNLAFGHSIKKTNFNYNAGYDLQIDNYNTGSETFRRNEHDVYFSPTISREAKRLKTTLRMPLHYINISGSDNIDDFSGVIFKPALSFQYNINYYTDLFLSGSLSSDLGSVYDVVSGVMKNYRTQYVFDGALPRRNSAGASFGVNYKNPVKALFAYFSLSYNNSTSKNTSEQIITETYIINKIIAGENTSRGFNASGRISKIFDWKRCSAKFNWNVSQSKSTQIQNSVITPFSNFSFSLNPSFDIETFASQILNYSFSYSAARVTTDSKKQPFMRNIKQNFTYYIPIVKKVNVMLVGEFLHNQVNANQHVNMFLMDVIVRYKVSPKMEFTLNCNNIFDTRQYSYSYYNDLYYTSYNYKLRPLNILFTANIQFK
ncbi:MAG: carboxypeptidase-like regulatory domain-containing protein [Prevotellaceae bacterium]|jgi:hypothetical protein|nr:carboxypeptidase-like regulatory domain-containing protein [Prevotellaceae bacterium]